MVSLALWSDDPEGALSVAEREWQRVLETEELDDVVDDVLTVIEHQQQILIIKTKIYGR